MRSWPSNSAAACSPTPHSATPPAKRSEKSEPRSPPGALKYLDKLTEHIYISDLAPAAYTSKCDLIDDLRTAIEDKRAVHILYQSEHATEPAFRDVYPLALIDRSRVLYLIAIDPRSDTVSIKHYKVIRIEDVELTNITFQRPADFDLTAYLDASFGIYQGDDDILIKVRFSPKVARYVLETRKHQSERLTKQRDGSVLAEYRLSSTKEFASWVLGFGPEAIVLAPESLREEIVMGLESSLATYSRTTASTRLNDFHERPQR